MRMGASKLLNGIKGRAECDGKCGLFSPNSGVVRLVMHPHIKSPATRECAPLHPRRGERRGTLIAKVIKPINAVLCAGCHCVQEIAPLISVGLFSFSHKPLWDWEQLQVLSTLVERYLSIALIIIIIVKTDLFLFFLPGGKIIWCLLSSYFILDASIFKTF